MTRSLIVKPGKLSKRNVKNAKPPASDIQALMIDGKAVDRAINLGIQDALLDHKQSGNPVATWVDGKVVWIAAEEIPE